VDLVGLVTYRGGILARRRSPIPVLTGLNVEQLSSCDERRYRYAKPANWQTTLDAAAAAADDDDDNNDGGGDDADELYLAHVVSSRSHALIINIDAGEALTMTGVVDFISHHDVPAHNRYASMDVTPVEETVFAADIVRLIHSCSIPSDDQTHYKVK